MNVKCGYKNCINEDRELNKEDAIKVGNRYYHQDCYQIIEDIREIADLFKKHINENVVYSVLVRVINDIIFNKKNESGYLLFGLRYYINKKIPLNYPQGLYYVIQNKDVKKAYEKFKINKINPKVDISEVEEHKFNFKPTKPKSVGDIFQ